jgi:hypothetical protein
MERSRPVFVGRKSAMMGQNEDAGSGRSECSAGAPPGGSAGMLGGVALGTANAPATAAASNRPAKLCLSKLSPPSNVGSLRQAISPACHIQ